MCIITVIIMVIRVIVIGRRASCRSARKNLASIALQKFNRHEKQVLNQSILSFLPIFACIISKFLLVLAKLEHSVYPAFKNAKITQTLGYRVTGHRVYLFACHRNSESNSE